MKTPATRVFMVRHGATVLSAEDRFAGATDVALSDEGREQTRSADARRLSGNFPRTLGTDDPARSRGKISGGSCGMGERPVHICARGWRKRIRRDGARVAGIDRISARTSRKKYFG